MLIVLMVTVVVAACWAARPVLGRRRDVTPPATPFDVVPFRVHLGSRIARVVLDGRDLVLHIDRPNAPAAIRLLRPARTSWWVDRVLVGAVVSGIEPAGSGVRVVLALPTGVVVPIGAEGLRWATSP